MISNRLDMFMQHGRSPAPHCPLQFRERHFNQAACLPAQMHKTYLALRIQESLPARTVFLNLLQREFAEEDAWESNFAWANTYADEAMDKNMLAIANSLFIDPVESGETSYNAPSMTAFITGLVDERQFDNILASCVVIKIYS